MTSLESRIQKLEDTSVTLNYCETKKQKYVSQELCAQKESALKDSVSEIKEICKGQSDDIKNIKENHLVHMQNDIAEMKVKITVYSGIAAFLASIAAQYLFR